MNGDNLIPLKDVPLRAIPVLVFLAAPFVFGTMVAELPTRTLLQQILSISMGIFAWASGILFFVKLFTDWPHTPGLHLPPPRRR
jgi:hypothetical protein